MAPEERFRFENEFKSNSDLKEDIDLLRQIITATAENEAGRFRNKLTHIYRADQKKISQAPRPLFRKWVLTLFGVIILLFSGFFIRLVWKTKIPSTPQPMENQIPLIPDNREQQIHEPNPLPETPRHQPNAQATDKKKNGATGGNYRSLALSEYQPLGKRDIRHVNKSEEKSNLEQARAAYGNKEWASVISLLALPDTAQLYESLKLRANAYFQVEDFENATVDFQHEIFLKTPYQYDAEWNLLVCQLALLPESRNAFDGLMEKILSNKTHSFLRNAENLQKKLKNLPATR